MTVHRAVAAEAHRLIHKAAARIMNDLPDTKPMSPERLRWTESIGMLWSAMNLLDPDACLPEDREAALKRIAELEEGKGR